MMWRSFFCLICCAFALTTQAQTAKESKSDAAARIHSELASHYQTAGQVAVAIDELNIALESRSDYVPAHTLLGIIYDQLRQDELANTHFLAALSNANRQKISDTDIRNHYARFLCRANRGDEALAQFTLIFNDSVYQNMGQALNNAGICAARLGRDELALAYLNAALEREPANAEARIHRGHVFVSTTKLEAARADLRFAQTQNSYPAAVLWLDIRLNHIQRHQSTNNLRAELITQFPTSVEAAWARERVYQIF
jgi:type IV pilus assembly protein PilF